MIIVLKLITGVSLFDILDAFYCLFSEDQLMAAKIPVVIQHKIQFYGLNLQNSFIDYIDKIKIAVLSTGIGKVMMELDLHSSCLL